MKLPEDTPYWFTAICPKDQMAAINPQEYFETGKKALDACIQALDGKTPSVILDFPSGHGRVMRWFRHEWPQAELHGVEVDSQALDFISETFGAHPIQSTAELDMPLPSNVDLIFSGSLLTHFDDWQVERFLERCIEALAPGGILLFTAHGRIAALLAEDKHPIYGELIDTTALYKTYVREGFAFAPYSPEYPTYGLTLSSPTWMLSRICNMPLARLVSMTEGGWGHQDVYVIQKHEWPLNRAQLPAYRAQPEPNDRRMFKPLRTKTA